MTIKQFHNSLVNKEFSALEATQDYFRRIKEKDGEIGAYLTLLEEGALRQAEEVDIAIAQGEDVPLLAGVPLAIKDNILIAGTRTTAASKILENYIASYDAGVIEKLKKERAVFLGKTNLDEFAMGSSTENSGFHITKNPYDLERVPGGSSGGSAAAVAADMAVAALGSDTFGSIRLPAAYCGCVGLKPTYGAVSRRGLIAMASSLDQIGPIAKTVEDAAILFQAIIGKDEFDATNINITLSDNIAGKIQNSLKIGLPEEYFVDGLDGKVADGVNQVIEKLKRLGFRFKPVSLPHTKYAVACYYIVMPAEVSANLARYDGMRYSRIRNTENLWDIYFKNKGAGFGNEVRRRVLLGTFVLSHGYYDAYYAKAQKVRRLIRDDFERVFKEVDVLLTPVSPTPAFKLGEKTKDPLQMYLSDVFTGPVNLAGLPALSVPVKEYEMGSGELPIGFQLIGKWFREADILGIGHMYEESI